MNDLSTILKAWLSECRRRSVGSTLSLRVQISTSAWTTGFSRSFAIATCFFFPSLSVSSVLYLGNNTWCSNQAMNPTDFMTLRSAVPASRPKLLMYKLAAFAQTLVSRLWALCRFDHIRGYGVYMHTGEPGFSYPCIHDKCYMIAVSDCCILFA